MTAAAVGIFNLFLAFLLPFIILVFCYGRILWMLSRRINTDISDGRSKFNHSGKEVTRHTDEMGKIKHAQKDKFQIARTNTMKTLLIVGCCFIICWSQNQVVYLMFNFGYDLDWNSDYWHFTNLMVFLNCTVNPFIYLFKYTDYQIALKAFFRCKAQDSNWFHKTALENKTSFQLLYCFLQAIIHGTYLHSTHLDHQHVFRYEKELFYSHSPCISTTFLESSYF